MAAAAALLATLAASACPAAAAPGDPDLTFGLGGTTVTSVGSAGAYPHAIAVEPGGAILVGGESYDGRGGFPLTLIRFTPTGALDGGFGHAGVATAPGTGLAAIAAAPGGRTVAVGYGARRGGHRLEPVIARFDSSGALDRGFGSGGLAGGPVGDGDAVARALVTAPDGSLAVASDAGRGGDRVVAVTRYSAAGRPLGTSYVALPGRSLTAAGIARTSGGRLLVAGTAYDLAAGRGDAFVERLLATGAPDPSFGGPLVVGSGVEVRALALEPGGAAVLAGSRRAPLRAEMAAVRVSPDGKPDPGFGDAGTATVPVGAADAFATGVAVDGAGRVVLCGTASDSLGNVTPILLRLDRHGASDPASAPAAELLPALAASPAALARDGAGRLVVAGSAFAAGRQELSLARYLGG